MLGDTGNGLPPGGKTALDELFSDLYDNLKRLACRRLRREQPGHALSPSALVHECYLRLVQSRQPPTEDRREFLAAASSAMRRVLIDHARTRARLKRGGGQSDQPADEATEWLEDRQIEETLQLNVALDRLARADARAARVVRLRFFAGLSLEEIAEVVGTSAKTVQRIWGAARAWLKTQIGSSRRLPPQPIGTSNKG